MQIQMQMWAREGRRVEHLVALGELAPRERRAARPELAAARGRGRRKPRAHGAEELARLGGVERAPPLLRLERLLLLLPQLVAQLADPIPLLLPPN